MRHTISRFLVLNLLTVLLFTTAGCGGKKPTIVEGPDVDQEPVLSPSEREAEEKYSKSNRSR